MTIWQFIFSIDLVRVLQKSSEDAVVPTKKAGPHEVQDNDVKENQDDENLEEANMEDNQEGTPRDDHIYSISDNETEDSLSIDGQVSDFEEEADEDEDDCFHGNQNQVNNCKELPTGFG